MTRNVIIGIVIGVVIVLAVVMFSGMENVTTVDTSNSPPTIDTGVQVPSAPDAPPTPTPTP